MSDNKDLIKKLCNLIHLDVDAAEAYTQALKNIDVPSIHTAISNFKADHERHVQELSRIVVEMGGEPPKASPDFKGFIIKGFTAIRSMTGTEGALKAMRGNEKLTNSTYHDALSSDDLPVAVRAIIQKNYEDEQRHLQYIEQALAKEIWKTTV